MEKFRLAFGIHNHQPIGNFESVFEEAHQKAYQPFLTLLASFDNISISLHQSGILWNWQKIHHPDFVKMVEKMVDAGRLELMTGGFYEPILTSIPTRDALGQIDMLSGFLRQQFGSDPEGLWLTERIWEPHLPRLLARAGIKWLPIDDTHFVYAGMEREQLVGPYVTEDEGNTVILLPIQKRLRYLIPFGAVAEVIDELRSQAEKRPGGLAIYADDGEKFGSWPDTHQHCYLDGWLSSFFEAVEQNSDWLQVVSLGRAAEAKPVGRAYLPSASYEEMLHWALPAHAFEEYEAFEKWLAEQGQKDRYGRFVRGGHWRGFLAKYDEANLMHKKMLRVSDQLSRLEKDQLDRADELELARDSLYASQCNCPYWHGVFGGLYLPHIRQAVFSRMIDAGNRIRQLAGETELTITELDYDSDGVLEIICDSELFTAVLKPDSGGMLLELSLNRHNFNLTDTMSRRREGYHAKLAGALSPDQEHGHASIHDRVVTKEEGLDKYIAEDWYLKRCLIDHFFSPGVDLETFGSGRYGEDGDFILEPYHADIDGPARRVIMTRDGLLRRTDGMAPVRVIKQIVFAPGSEEIEIMYELSSRHPGGVEVDFAVENNFNFQAGHAADRYLLVDGRRATRDYLDATGEHKQAGSIILADEYRSLAAAVSSDRPADIWHLPIFTVSLSEGGFEKVYQGTTIVHRYRLSLSEYPQYVSLRLLAGDLETVLAGAFRKATVGS